MTSLHDTILFMRVLFPSRSFGVESWLADTELD